jgi:hypothetical protein
LKIAFMVSFFNTQRAETIFQKKCRNRGMREKVTVQAPLRDAGFGAMPPWAEAG